MIDSAIIDENPDTVHFAAETAKPQATGPHEVAMMEQEGVRYVHNQRGRFHLEIKKGRLGYYGMIIFETVDRRSSNYMTVRPRSESAVLDWGRRKLDKLDKGSDWRAV